MTRVALGNDLYIDHDGEHNWRLMRARVAQKGKAAGETREGAIGYYGSLEGLVRRLLDRRYQSLGTFAGLHELATAISVCETHMAEAIQDALFKASPHGS